MKTDTAMTVPDALRITHRLIREGGRPNRELLDWIEQELQHRGEPLYPVQEASPILSWPLINSTEPLGALRVSYRVLSALKRNFSTVGQVAMCTVEEIMAIRWFGPVALVEVRAGLHRLEQG